MNLKHCYPMWAGKTIRMIGTSATINVPNSDSLPFTYTDSKQHVWLSPAFMDSEVVLVEPKSKIEEAIERLRGDALTYTIEKDTKGYDLRDRVDDAMRRIVNLTLEEAIDVVKHFGYVDSVTLRNKIDALKVKV